MKKIGYLLILMLTIMLGCNTNLPLPAGSKQVLLVIAENDTTIRGTAQLFQWENKQLRWLSLTDKTPITLGRTGLAWGKGLHDTGLMQGKLKKEGDGKAPMGFFAITKLFGYAEASKLPFTTQMPYIQATSNLICVDDVNSKHYNEMLDKTAKTEIDWQSKEDMLRTDNLYEFGAVIDYNLSTPVKGDGSCVFLHIWRGETLPTAGCTAGDYQAMQKIFSLLNPTQKPILVQLTRDEYDKIKALVSLP